MKDMKKMARTHMLKELSKEMRGMMGDNYGKSLKKVTVASPTEEGLEEGLTKAQQILKMREEMGKEEESEEMDEIEEDESPEELKEKISKLSKKLKE